VLGTAMPQLAIAAVTALAMATMMSCRK
jgi:hypothetical protein